MMESAKLELVLKDETLPPQQMNQPVPPLLPQQKPAPIVPPSTTPPFVPPPASGKPPGGPLPPQAEQPQPFSPFPSMSDEIRRMRDLYRMGGQAELDTSTAEFQDELKRLKKELIGASLKTYDPDVKDVIMQFFEQEKDKIDQQNEEANERRQEAIEKYLTGQIPYILLSDPDMQAALDATLAEEMEKGKKMVRERTEARQQAFKDYFQGQIPQVVPVDPMVRRVQKDMDSEEARKEERRSYNQTRREMDPEFARKQDREKTNTILNMIGLALGKGNIPIVAQTGLILQSIASHRKASDAAPQGETEGDKTIAQTNAIISAAGGAAAALNELGRMTATQIKQFGNFTQAMLAGSMNADDFASEMNEAVKKIPFVGQVFGALGDSLGNLVKTTDSMADRLAQYNPELAMKQAEIEVRNVFRDIHRANTMGDELARYLQQRQELRESLEDTLIPVATRIIPILTTILNYIQAILNKLGIVVANTEPPIDPGVNFAQLMTFFPPALPATTTPQVTAPSPGGVFGVGPVP